MPQREHAELGAERQHVAEPVDLVLLVGVELLISPAECVCCDGSLEPSDFTLTQDLNVPRM